MHRGSLHRFAGASACLVLIAVLLLKLASCGGSGFDSAKAAQLDQVVNESLVTYSSPGMLLYVASPQTGEYLRTAGLAEIDSATSMSVGPLFRIGSCTKTFTGTAILTLVQEGRIGLDDTIDKYIAGVPNGNIITIRHLLKMRSGLSNYSESATFGHDFDANPNHSFTPQELLAYAWAMPIMFAPGTQYYYSNTNTVLLGLVVEKVNPEGDNLDQAIKRRISNPLGMTNTFLPNDGAMPGAYIHGYMPTQPPDDVSLMNPSWGWAAGAMISNFYDMRTYTAALGNGSLLSAQMQALRMSDFESSGMPAYPTAQYGLGWATVGGFYGHSGALPGYVNMAMYDPSTQTTIYLMLNTQPTDGDATMNILTRVIKIMFPDRAL